jgi:hypothetical protein
MKKIYLCSAAILTLACGATAQIRIGGEAGINLNNLLDHYQGETVSNQIKVGWHAGFLADIGLGGHLAVQPGLRFSMKGGEETMSNTENVGTGYVQTETKDKITLDYIELPVNVVYKFGASGNGFMIGVGPYLAYCVHAEDKYKSKVVTALNGENPQEIVDEGVVDLEIGNNKDEDNIKALDYGAQAFVGYQLPMGLFVKGGGQFGLANILPQGSADFKSKNYNFYFTLGYLLGGK